jgi:hypothetical protein
MTAALQNRVVSRGSGLLIAHCAAMDCEERLPAAHRLQLLIGADLTRLLLVALAGDHRMDARLRLTA